MKRTVDIFSCDICKTEKEHGYTPPGLCPAGWVEVVLPRVMGTDRESATRHFCPECVDRIKHAKPPTTP